MLFRSFYMNSLRKAGVQDPDKVIVGYADGESNAPSIPDHAVILSRAVASIVAFSLKNSQLPTPSKTITSKSSITVKPFCFILTIIPKTASLMYN